MWSDGVMALAVAGGVAAGLTAGLHAILYKRDVRAAIGWAGFIFVAPYAGPILYLLFGINRVRRSAATLRRSEDGHGADAHLPAAVPGELAGQALLGDRVCGNQLLPGNRVEILEGGERAFAAMLARIAAAQRSILLATYIFEYDRVGRRFADALAAARVRGVTVRVLVDAIGVRSRRAAITTALQQAGIRTAVFLPRRLLGAILSINLRNHRKITIIDGEVAFTGGINFSEDYEAAPSARPRIADVHFEVEGPIVASLQRAFASNWLFATGERLPDPNPAQPAANGVVARVVADGPDEAFERSRWLMLGAITMARRSIRIVTPYFLPDMPLITALGTAALRGVRVDILIPERIDHRIVKWASNALLWQVLEKGCRVWFTPPPFDHSKLFTIDGIWSFFGSSNWDARSLRLNFELNLEAIGAEVAQQIDATIERRLRSAREITLEEMDARPLPVRIRDGLARLLTPYL